ncbi:DUF6262 family protein [Candidatus Mycobacterium methanotrophicum]|uniref:DUF6262 family protein n=1 Tax=Candidatus Mycobacterium methanotrophicum TaxID=2943498 RepID=A0ABY4QQW0_9MYCO|nr:DUF6262 family protein [Candidatus Mycobacterium methanotrophicum]UQX12276.1 DUF6262 family protein [Candidatus Mycobacterium methanotrophicum]
MTDPRTDKLIAARRLDSRTKYERTQQALATLVKNGNQISFASVAREAKVSTWLLYNNSDLKQAITEAINHQTNSASQPASTARSASVDSLRTDLELARQEITQLRRSERKLRDRLQRTLGAEIEQIDRSELIARIADLEILVTKLRADNTELLETNARLTELVDQQGDDLDSANTLLRRYMKEASRAQSAAPS